jgi:hypothetical protein
LRDERDAYREQVEGLRQERDRALADLQAAQIAQAEAEADAAELRQADAARRARGRWARIRAAWTRGIVLWLDEFYLFWR